MVGHDHDDGHVYDHPSLLWREGGFGLEKGRGARRLRGITGAAGGAFLVGFRGRTRHAAQMGR